MYGYNKPNCQLLTARVVAACLREKTVPCGVEVGLEPVLVLINAQDFTKTANCWGVDNNRKGTNTNRIVLFRKPRRRSPRRAASGLSD